MTFLTCAILQYTALATSSTVCVQMMVYSPRSDDFSEFQWKMMKSQTYKDVEWFIRWNGKAGAGEKSKTFWTEKSKTETKVHFSNEIHYSTIGKKRNNLLQDTMMWEKLGNIRCEYIMIWDDDDVYLPKYIETYVDAFAANPDKLAVFSKDWVYFEAFTCEGSKNIENNPPTAGSCKDPKSWVRAHPGGENENIPLYARETSIFTLGYWRNSGNVGGYGFMHAFRRSVFDDKSVRWADSSWGEDNALVGKIATKFGFGGNSEQFLAQKGVMLEHKKGKKDAIVIHVAVGQESYTRHWDRHGKIMTEDVALKDFATEFGQETKDLICTSYPNENIKGLVDNRIKEKKNKKKNTASGAQILISAIAIATTLVAIL